MRMQARAEDYLAMRRSLGFKLRGEGRMLGGSLPASIEKARPPSPYPRPWRGRPNHRRPRRHTGGGG